MAKSQKAAKAVKPTAHAVAVVKPVAAAVAARKARKAANAVSIGKALQLPNGIAQQVAAPAAVVAKLTKRSSLLVGQVLVATTKPVRVRAPHVQAAWAAVVAALPATSTQLAQLPALAHPQCVSPQGFISYMHRRGYLAVK